MKDPRRSRLASWAVPASLVLHGAFVALLLFGLPSLDVPPPPEQSIPVTLVPPPEAAKPPAPEPPKPEPDKAAPQTAAAPPPPPPEPQPTPQTEPQPAPQPEPAPPEPVQTPAAQAPTPPAPAMTALEPVFKFGPTDAGPRQTPQGDSAKDDPNPEPSAPQAQDEANQPDPAAPPEAPDPTEPERAAPPAATERADDAVTPTTLSELEAPNGAAPGHEVQDAKAPDPAIDLVPEPSAMASAKAEAAETPDPKKPAQPVAKPDKPRKPPASHHLYSRAQTQAEMATTAMGNLPRDVRAGRICVTELRQQLLHASPPYFAEILPSYRLQQGDVLAVPSASFRMGGQWFDLNFRCTIDADATEVTGFAFKVGAALSSSERERRGLPSR